MGGVFRCYHVSCSVLVIRRGSLGVAWGGWARSIVSGFWVVLLSFVLSSYVQ